MAKIWTRDGGKDGWFFVEDADPGDPEDPTGRGVTLGGKTASPPMPLSSFVVRNPEAAWAPYEGDPAPVLAALEAAGGAKGG